ncbi:MAG: amidohydrolase [Anaerolineales bacterium]|nr:amidohydrolase [Anaerolineales bacterium]
MVEKADLILYNARIFTVDSARPWAEAVACAEGRIVAVGSNEEVLNLAGRATQRIDAGGRLVLPGLTDAHVHFLQYAIRRQEVSLFGVRNFEEVRRRVRQAVEKAAPGQWVQGWGWDENLWDRPPAAGQLDDIAPHTPVVLARMDMHTWWVNSAAMQQAGITRETPDPPESRLERDADGNPTGLLREWNAIRLVEPHLPKPSSATLLGWLKEAIAEAHRLGLTGIHDQRVQREGRQTFRLFQALRRQGELKLRVHMNIAAEHLAEAAALGLQPGFGDDRLWIGHLKTFADGTMGSRTARMIEPFEGEPDNYGLAVTPANALWELAVQAKRAGFSLSVHAIGDLAVREVVDVLSELPSTEQGTASAERQAGEAGEQGRDKIPPAPPPPRPPAAFPHRIEHVQVIHPDDLPRLSQYGIVASVQPVHLLTDWPTADKVWGRRSQYAYAFRSLLEHGTRLALGSDAPVAPLNPMLGIYAAVTRQDERGQPANGWYPEERLTVAEAVHGYTLGPAYLAGKQEVQGTIMPGKWADMVVLSRNLFEIPPEEIAEAAVEVTVFDGQVVYQAEM